MAFKIKFSYKVREGLKPISSVSSPEGSLSAFLEHLNAIDKHYKDKEDFKLEAEFHG